MRPSRAVLAELDPIAREEWGANFWGELRRELGPEWWAATQSDVIAAVERRVAHHTRTAERHTEKAEFVRTCLALMRSRGTDPSATSARDAALSIYGGWTAHAQQLSPNSGRRAHTVTDTRTPALSLAWRLRRWPSRPPRCTGRPAGRRWVTSRCRRPGTGVCWPGGARLPAAPPRRGGSP